MKRLAAVAFLLLLAPIGLFGASGQPVIDGYLEPAGYAQITDVSSAVGLTVPNGTKLTLVQAEAQNVRWRDDGTNPLTTVGMILEAGQTLVYNGNPTTLKFIEVSAGAKLNVSFYR